MGLMHMKYDSVSWVMFNFMDIFSYFGCVPRTFEVLKHVVKWKN